MVCGATGGHQATVDLRRVFAMRLEILGAHHGHARPSWRRCWTSCVAKDIRPVIDSTYGFTAVADAFARLDSGEVFGKVAIDHLH